MSLSEEHLKLVFLISEWCSERENKDSYLELLDDLNSGAGKGPPSTGAHIPDLAWMTLDNTFRFIGEAKTGNDIHNEHTWSQLAEYIRLLDAQDKGELILAVPKGHEKSSRALLARIERELRPNHCVWHVVTPSIRNRAI